MYHCLLHQGTAANHNIWQIQQSRAQQWPFQTYSTRSLPQLSDTLRKQPGSMSPKYVCSTKFIRAPFHCICQLHLQETFRQHLLPSHCVPAKTGKKQTAQKHKRKKCASLSLGGGCLFQPPFCSLRCISKQSRANKQNSDTMHAPGHTTIDLHALDGFELFHAVSDQHKVKLELCGSSRASLGFRRRCPSINLCCSSVQAELTKAAPLALYRYRH